MGNSVAFKVGAEGLEMLSLELSRSTRKRKPGPSLQKPLKPPSAGEEAAALADKGKSRVSSGEEPLL